METNEMDLPLNSSLDKYKVSHYSMSLTVDMEGMRLHGEVLLHIRLLGEQLYERVEGEGDIFQLSLDCNDIAVDKVEVVEKSNCKEGGRLNAVSLLSHDLTLWALNIRAEGPGPPPCLIRIFL